MPCSVESRDISWTTERLTFRLLRTPAVPAIGGIVFEPPSHRINRRQVEMALDAAHPTLEIAHFQHLVRQDFE